jgi:hypothetical protein
LAFEFQIRWASIEGYNLLSRDSPHPLLNDYNCWRAKWGLSGNLNEPKWGSKLRVPVSTLKWVYVSTYESGGTL